MSTVATLGAAIIRDIYANLPAAGVPGRLFFASDTGNSYRDNGLGWDPVGGGGSHAPDAEVAFISSEGNFTLAHGLGYTPTTAIISLTSLGMVAFQGGSPLLRWDGTNFYLQGSAAGLTGFIEVWK